MIKYTWVYLIIEVFIIIHPHLHGSLRIMVQNSRNTAGPSVWRDFAENMADTGTCRDENFSAAHPHLEVGIKRAMVESGVVRCLTTSSVNGSGLGIQLGAIVTRSNKTWSNVISTSYDDFFFLTHWGRDKMATISQTTFSNTFCWMSMNEFHLIFHWSLFLRFELTIFQHWFRKWLGADQATSH